MRRRAIDRVQVPYRLIRRDIGKGKQSDISASKGLQTTIKGYDLSQIRVP